MTVPLASPPKLAVASDADVLVSTDGQSKDQHVAGDFSIGFLGTSAELLIRASAAARELPHAAIVRLPLEQVRDSRDRNLIESFASACSLVFVDLNGGSTNQALPAIIRTGTSAVANLPSGLSLRELRNMRKLCEEARIVVGVSRPMRFQPALQKLVVRGRADLVWVDLHVQSGTPKTVVLGDLVDSIVSLVDGRSVQRIDSRTSADTSGQGETLGINIRFQNSALAMIRLRIDSAPRLEESTIRVSGGWGEATARLVVPPYVESIIECETSAFLKQFVANASVPSTLDEALEVTRIVELIMARLRQHDRLAV